MYLDTLSIRSFYVYLNSGFLFRCFVKCTKFSTLLLISEHVFSKTLNYILRVESTIDFCTFSFSCATKMFRVTPSLNKTMREQKTNRFLCCSILCTNSLIKIGKGKKRSSPTRFLHIYRFSYTQRTQVYS